ncbi:DegT/DnrJ/EryC1/StrS family aminotransferase [Streptomyces netropsis]|uniref:dTDP-4-amino-4,6-dideoxygalactose transaminase n=2 Tax=Streptomyces netropsis TaxID=55404 RepID=A0A7W7LHS4_STRNE|nr:DegT/DnrJ/EryC1/StrS family aminotransferase [Streptomyces netropsis]MBB4890430.1 dTDP-4-amino-4,6-dideoxygalactose transaminase [Streptomyces netropsis]
MNPTTDPPAETPRVQEQAMLWPWWSEGAVEMVRWLLDEGDMAAAGRDHPQIAECEQLAGDVLAPGRPVMLCDSGTGALETGYAALQVEPGSEVLVASHSFRATVTAMLSQGLVPVLCDADPATGGIDLRDAAARLTPRTAALTVTHTWGRPVPLDAVRRFGDRHHLALIEDCSHAHGTTWRGRPVGTVGDVAVWSCGTWKMATGGKGGLLTARDRMVWERAQVLAHPKHHALARVRDPRLRALAVTGAGHNRRPTPVAAVLVADHLRRLPHTLATKTERQTDVEKLLANAFSALVPLPEPTGRTAGALYKWHWRLADPSHPVDAVIRALHTAGVRARRPARPLHHTPLFTDPGLGAALRLPPIPPADPDGFPGTDRLLAGLVEIDTRDMYEPLPDGDPDPYERALAAAARELHTLNRKDR